MDGLQIENTSDKLVLRIDKENFSESVLLKIMRVSRLEYLICNAGFDEAVLQIDEDIKENWWQENRDEILRKAGQ